MPFILNEDAAIKAKLSGIQVSAASGLIDVPVRFGVPDPEHATMTYPSIVIYRQDVSRATDRESRGWTKYTYTIEGKPKPEEGDMWGYFGERPIPYNIDYRIVVTCRTQAQQSELMAILARGDRIPERGGFIHIDPPGVVAGMELIGGPDDSWTVDQHGKRLINTHYVVRVYTEFSPWEIQRYELVREVSGTIRDFDGRTGAVGRVLSGWTDTAPDT